MQRPGRRDATLRGSIAGLLVLGTLVLPSALAADAPAATAQPSLVRPGGRLEITFTVQDPALLGLVGASIGSQVSCAISAPDGSTTSGCVAVGPIVEADVAPSTRSYVWTLAAPAPEGAYRVHLARTSTLSLPSDGASADTTFVVSTSAPASPNGTGDPRGDPLTSTQTGPDAPGGSTAAPRTWFVSFLLQLGITPPAAADAPSTHRMLAANVAGSGTLLVLLFALRHGGSP